MSAPFLQSQLGANAYLRVRVAWGADLTAASGTWSWTDITSDVMFAADIQITVGRQDETSIAQPASCAFKLLNTSGDYTPFNPLGTNWPNVRRNTPVWVEVTLDNSTWATRFFGFANGFTPSWDTTANLAIVTVSASGVTRRLNQGKTPLRSSLERSIVGTSPLAYWPLEDGGSTITAESPIASVAGLSQLVDEGFSFGVPKFATLTGVPGSDALPDWSNGADMWAPVLGGTAGAGGWTVDVSLFSGLSTSTDDIIFLGITTGPYAPKYYQTEGFYLSLVQSGSPTKWQVAYQYSSGGTFFSTPIITPSFASSVNPFDGSAHLVRLKAYQSGSDFVVQLFIDGTLRGSATVSSRTLQAVTAIEIGNEGFSYAVPLAIGHASVWNGLSAADQTTAMLGHPGETPQARIERLCGEEGITYTTAGFYDTTQAMGAQGVESFMNLVRECETTDAGFLYDGLADGLTYQGISQRYDQALAMTLDVSTFDLADFVPVDDDQRIRNKVTVNRRNGSNATHEDTDGDLGTAAVGVYDTSVSVNTQYDSALDDRAHWDVWAGTRPGLRYPMVMVDFAARPSLAASWLSRGDGFSGPVVPGCRIDATNASSVATQHPVGTVSLMLEGYSESLSPVKWLATLNMSQNRVYDVFKIADSRLGRIGTDGSTLASSASAGATSLSVASSGALWTTTATYPADFPFDVEIDGIQVTVTAITGTLSPQTFTVTGATVTKDLASGKAVTTWHGGVIKL